VIDIHPPIDLHGKDFAAKLMLNKLLKIMKGLKNFGFVTQKIYPRKFAIIVDKS
jgi:hypothetical protein